MKNVLILFVVLLPLCFCGVRPSAGVLRPETGDSLSGPGYSAEDRFRIRLADTVALPEERRFPSGGADTGTAWLDRALDSVGAVGLVRVFAGGGRFAERRRRYGLHLWYEVHTDGSMPVGQCVRLFGSLPGVTAAERLARAELAESGEKR